MQKELKTVAKVVNDLISGGALALDNEDDCRDLAQQFADAFKLKGAEREAFAKASGYVSAEAMDMQRDCDDEECGQCESCKNR